MKILSDSEYKKLTNVKLANEAAEMLAYARDNEFDSFGLYYFKHGSKPIDATCKYKDVKLDSVQNLKQMQDLKELVDKLNIKSIS